MGLTTYQYKPVSQVSTNKRMRWEKGERESEKRKIGRVREGRGKRR